MPKQDPRGSCSLSLSAYPALRVSYSCSGPCSKSRVKGKPGTSSAKGPTGQLSSAVPTQFSPVCVWSLHWGAASQPSNFWDRGAGMRDSFCSKHRASTNQRGIRAGQGATISSQALPELPGQSGLGSPHLAPPCRTDDYWLSKGFPPG